MTTKKRLWFIFAVMLCSFPVKAAFAQTWYVQPNTRPVQAADLAQLPFSTTFDFSAPDGWIPTNGMTWEPVWPRNAAGAWYRPLAYTQPSLYRSNLWAYPYRCDASGAGFRCLDIARGIWRTINCPASTTLFPMRLWRGSYTGAWPEFGLFTVDRGRFAASELKTIQLQRASTSTGGQTINCSYGRPTINGPGTSLDVWVYRW